MNRCIGLLVFISAFLPGFLAAQDSLSAPIAPMEPPLPPSSMSGGSAPPMTPFTSSTLLLVYADDESAITVTEPDGTSAVGYIGMEIADGTVIKTGKTGVEMQMQPNGSVIKLAPDTTFRVDALIGNPGAVTNNFSLLAGKLRMAAAKLSNPAPAYRISTPTAICGIRGTDFARRYDPGSHEDWLCVLEGVVDFRSPDGKSAVTVAGGNFVELGEGFVAKPVPASWVTNNFKDIRFVKARAPK
ncbi:MAG TPA: FecR family protein [Spirochaetia bacterium]|nr:FecR family protein [Spirochaetia bacterium]